MIARPNSLTPHLRRDARRDRPADGRLEGDELIVGSGVDPNDREIALVVDRKEPWAGTHEILGVGRLSKVHGTDEAEFALLVGDRHQGRGIGSELLGAGPCRPGWNPVISVRVVQE